MTDVRIQALIDALGAPIASGGVLTAQVFEGRKPAVRISGEDATFPVVVRLDLTGAAEESFAIYELPPTMYWRIFVTVGSYTVSRNVVLPAGAGPFDFADLVDVNPSTALPDADLSLAAAFIAELEAIRDAAAASAAAVETALVDYSTTVEADAAYVAQAAADATVAAQVSSGPLTGAALSASVNTTIETGLTSAAAQAIADTPELSATIAEVGAERFAPTDATASTFAHIRSKLDTDLEDVTIAVLGDSTGSGATRWVRLFVNSLAALYPTKTVVLHDWDVPTNAYTAPAAIQTGTGARTITVYNGSASGQNTTYSQTHLLTMVPVVCDLVFINHGHNMTGTEDTQASQKYYALARDILRWSSPSAALVFIGQNPETPADANMEAHRTRLVKLAAVCATNGWGFLNLTEVFLANADWVADWMTDTKHPNDAGSIVIADYIWGLFTNPRIKYAAPVAAPAAFDRIWVPAVQMYPNVVLDTFPKMEILGGWPTMEFGNASGPISAHASVEIPYSWQQVNVWLYWTVHIAVPGGNIMWDLRYASSFRIGTELSSGSNTVGLNNTQTPTPASAHAVPTVNYGEVHSVLLRNATLAPGNDVKATSRIVSLMIRRLASDVADTFADSGNVLGILVERAL